MYIMIGLMTCRVGFWVILEIRDREGGERTWRPVHRIASENKMMLNIRISVRSYEWLETLYHILF